MDRTTLLIIIIVLLLLFGGGWYGRTPSLGCEERVCRARSK